MSANLPDQWLSRATEDLVVARLVLREDHAAHACFLAQQCIEKALKAFLLQRKNVYPRTRKLVDLANECVKDEPAFAQFATALVIVDQYYVPTRYPDGIPGSLASGLPSRVEADEAIATAEQVLQFVTSHLD